MHASAQLSAVNIRVANLDLAILRLFQNSYANQAQKNVQHGNQLSFP
jgi:hypothetical protein